MRDRLLLRNLLKTMSGLQLVQFDAINERRAERAAGRPVDHITHQILERDKDIAHMMRVMHRIMDRAREQDLLQGEDNEN